jgi:hypothetical protein
MTTAKKATNDHGAQSTDGSAPRRPSYLMPALAPRVELAPSFVDFFR